MLKKKWRTLITRREEIKSSLNEAEIKADETLSAKTKKIVDVIDGFKGQFINEKMLKKVMSIQSLVKEIKD